MAADKENTYLNVVVDDLDENTAAMNDELDEFSQGCFIEGPTDTAKLDGAHSIVRPVLRIASDDTLHGDTTIEKGIAERGDWEDVGDRGEGIVVSKGVASKGRVVLYETFRANAIECGLISDDEGIPGELRGDEYTIRVAEGILLSSDVDVRSDAWS